MLPMLKRWGRAWRGRAAEMVSYLPNWARCENESFKGLRAQSGVALSWPGEDLWLN